MPMFRELVLGFSFGYSWLIKSFCLKWISTMDLEVHRVLLKIKDGKKGVPRKRLLEWERS